MRGILGKKLDMPQIFTDEGFVIPVSVVKAGHWLVVQGKPAETDGYEAVQIGLVEDNPPKRVPKPEAGRFQKAGIPPVRRVAEFGLDQGDEEAKAGDEVK